VPAYSADRLSCCQSLISLLISIPRPDSYIGSIEKLTEYQWVYDEDKGLNYRNITYVPGLYKVC
jgi:hypothetical protein